VNAGKFERVIANQASVILAICPVSSPNELRLFDEAHERTLFFGLRPLFTSAWDHEVHGNRFVTLSQYRGVVYAATEIDLHGMVSAIDCRLVKTRPGASSGGQMADDILLIPSVTFEKGIIEGIQRYLKALLDLKAPGPWLISLGLIGLRRSELGVSPSLCLDGRVFEAEEILPSPIEIDPNIDLGNPQAIARAIRPAFDYVWREYNYPQSLNYSEAGDWIGH
jgi:hypothetical protein